YTTLVNLPIADDGETETGETATFSLAAGEGYEIIEDYSGGTFNLVDTEADIPRGIVTEPNDIISAVVTDTEITPENPSFSAADSIYFNIGNRYLNEDGTYTYIDYNEDVDLYQVNLTAGDTVAAEVFEREENREGSGLFTGLSVLDADGNRLGTRTTFSTTAAPDKLFGNGGSALNEDGTVNEGRTEAYLEFTAPEDGVYYFGVSGYISAGIEFFGETYEYSATTPGLGDNNRVTIGNYRLDIDLLTPDNPRNVAAPTPPVSNPDVTNPPTLSLSASPATVDSGGNFTNGVVEFVETGGISNVTFTIQAEGDIPEGGIEFVLNSNANLFDYVSFLGQNALPSTIGGQSLGAFYNEEGIPTGIRLLIEEPTMTVTYEAANRADGLIEIFGLEPILDEFEPLETDGAEDVAFFLQPGEGYEIAPDAGTTEVTYYDSVADVPPPAAGETVPEVGVTITETNLIETEETETTLIFTLSEPPPEGGVIVALDSNNNDLLIGSPLSQFDVLNAEITGGDFPTPNADTSGFFFNITEQTATITLSVFNELTVVDDVLLVEEGIVGLNFALQPQAGYTIDEDASEINLTIADNPDSKIQVSLTGSTEGDEESTTLIESEGTVSVHTFSLSAPPPAEGLTVSVSADSLDDFDLDAIEVQGGTIANLSDDGFDLTITEREATISLPVLDDGVTEGAETATFALESGDTYQINQAAVAATFELADTLADVGQAGVSEELERNNTIAQANALGLNAENSTVSIEGSLNEYSVPFPGRGFGYPEDVDFYSVVLEAGQTVAFDVDGAEQVPNNRFTVFPEQSESIMKVDSELRLFDAAGNELAANSDGAAPGEEFSRDPYLEFTAPEAGTYFVGVSALGNRNYDPNVEGSGSGWTFPEVGVFFGDYDLTATLTEEGGGGTGGGLTGTDDADMLMGTDSDDLLDGLLGDDTYTGGAGADQFVLGLGQGVDTITDFEVGVDQISLGGLTPSDVRFFDLNNDTLVLTNSNELIGVVEGVTGLYSIFA
ncbi:MAG: D-alanyl-D-alanine carboxypeptidase, partial [Leptolyngbya sp. SIO4C1]|nr:D-alanyl-D-alanine carboxypeptidase [Leptolyngbya sp. SIO4C1]